MAIVGRQPILRNADAASLYQVTAALQTPVPSALTSTGVGLENRQKEEQFDKLLFFHPGQRRMVVYDRSTASVVPLFPSSIAATPLLATAASDTEPQSGYLITVPSGLEYVPLSQQSEFDRRRGVPASTEEGVAVISGAYLPRLTTDSVWRTLLLGPNTGGRGPGIHLYRLMIAGAEGGASGGRE